MERTNANRRQDALALQETQQMKLAPVGPGIDPASAAAMLDCSLPTLYETLDTFVVNGAVFVSLEDVVELMPKRGARGRR